MRRTLAVLTAVLLAGFGAVVLISYVRGADARAEAGAVLVPVLVVADDVPAGTAVEDLAGKVNTEQVPQRLVASGALDDLAAVAGLTTTVQLLPGDQVVVGRFADPAVQAAGQVVVPEGMQEVSLTLELQRAVGGALVAGDRVAVYTSGAGTDPATGTSTTTTGLAAAEVLVTRVDAAGDAALTGTSGTVIVTLALDQAVAVPVIEAMTGGGVWLTLQESTGSADTSFTSTTTTAGENQ